MFNMMKEGEEEVISFIGVGKAHMGRVMEVGKRRMCRGGQGAAGVAEVVRDVSLRAVIKSNIDSGSVSVPEVVSR